MNLKLDQFFTQPDIALGCWKEISPLLKKLTGKDTRQLFFVEPSAGDGAFYDLLPRGKQHRLGIDIEPRRTDFIKDDFLTWSTKKLSHKGENIIVIGNPPFGKRGDLAIKFFNKASLFSDTIAFIVPVIFRKFFIHKNLNKDFKWIHSIPLPREAFTSKNKKVFAVNTEFQLWTRIDGKHKDKRLFSPPDITHKDFYMMQYNNTKEALKVFNYKFDFAIPSQGWQDYSRREKKADKCEKHKQWMLFKTYTKEVYSRLYADIDYNELALKNTTSIPGFRKCDIVEEYSQRYG